MTKPIMAPERTARSEASPDVKTNLVDSGQSKIGKLELESQSKSVQQRKESGMLELKAGRKIHTLSRISADAMRSTANRVPSQPNELSLIAIDNAAHRSPR